MKRCISRLLSLALLFGLFCGAGPQAARAEDGLTEEIVCLYQEGEYGKAAALADEYLDEPGIDTQFILHAAMSYYNSDRIGDAIATYEWLISFGFTDGYSIAAYYNLGMIHAVTGNYQKATQYYEAYWSIAESADMLDARRAAFYDYGRAYLQFYLGNMEQAIALMEQSLSHQDIGNIASTIGYFYELNGDAGRALEIYKQAEAEAAERTDDAARATALSDIAHWHLIRKEYGKALEVANQSIALDPGLDDAHIFKAMILYCSGTGELQDALDHLTIAETYAVLPREIAYLSAWRGAICEKMGDEAAARDGFDAALRFVPSARLSDYFYQAMIYALAGDTAASIDALAHACEGAPGYKYDVAIEIDFDKIRSTPAFQEFASNNYTLLAPGATPPSDWARREVDAARAYRLIPAALDGDYQNNITRAEFCALAAALIEAKTGSAPAALLAGQQAAPEPGAFTDTDEDSVLMISRLGIVNGYGDGTFGPNDPITREQAAAMLMRLAKVLGLTEPNSAPLWFADAQAVSPWAADGVSFVSRCVADGKRVMGGTGGDLFSPAERYTREQSFATFLRLYQCLPASVTTLHLP